MTEDVIASFAELRKRCPLHKLEDFDYCWAELKLLMAEITETMQEMRDMVPSPPSSAGSGKPPVADA